MSTCFLLNISRFLTVLIDIDHKGHLRAMTFRTRSWIWLKWCCLRQAVKSWWGKASRSFRVGAGARQGDTLFAIPALVVGVFYSDSGYVIWCTTPVVAAEAAIAVVAAAVGAAVTLIMMTMTMTTAITTAAAATKNNNTLQSLILKYESCFHYLLINDWYSGYLKILLKLIHLSFWKLRTALTRDLKPRTWHTKQSLCSTSSNEQDINKCK